MTIRQLHPVTAQWSSPIWTRVLKISISRGSSRSHLTAPGSTLNSIWRLEQELATLSVKINIPRGFLQMRNWPTWRKNPNSFADRPAGWPSAGLVIIECCQSKSCQDTSLLSYQSEVIDVSLLHFWVLHDFAHFDSHCFVNVILLWFYALRYVYYDQIVIFSLFS